MQAPCCAAARWSPGIEFIRHDPFATQRGRVGKGAGHVAVWFREPFAPCPRRRCGGHAEPVSRPAEGRTRWLCPPYGQRSKWQRKIMCYRNLIGAGVFAALLTVSIAAQAFDDAKYPD